jgi:hypothetical protein
VLRWFVVLNFVLGSPFASAISTFFCKDGSGQLIFEEGIDEYFLDLQSNNAPTSWVNSFFKTQPDYQIYSFQFIIPKRTSGSGPVCNFHLDKNFFFYCETDKKTEVIVKHVAATTIQKFTMPNLILQNGRLKVQHLNYTGLRQNTDSMVVRLKGDRVSEIKGSKSEFVDLTIPFNPLTCRVGELPESPAR